VAGYDVAHIVHWEPPPASTKFRQLQTSANRYRKESAEFCPTLAPQYMGRDPAFDEPRFMGSAGNPTVPDTDPGGVGVGSPAAECVDTGVGPPE